MSRKLWLSIGTAAAALGLASAALAAKGTIDAATMKITIYKFAVSKTADCKDPIVVFDNPQGVTEDLLASPTYGSGPVDPGTYPCVMIELSKMINTSPKTTGGSCTQDAAFEDVICGDGQTSQLIDGTAVSCAGGATAAQHVTLYVTTASAGQGGDRALMPPLSATDTTSGLKLTAALVVTGNLPVTLSVDPKQFLDGSNPVCSTSSPSFSVQ